ncbi:MAG: hypothetical protein ACE5QV_07375 [Fidelibacterota bacterium]
MALLAAIRASVTTKDTGWDPERSVPIYPFDVGGKSVDSHSQIGSRCPFTYGS